MSTLALYSQSSDEKARRVCEAVGAIELVTPAQKRTASVTSCPQRGHSKCALVITGLVGKMRIDDVRVPHLEQYRLLQK